MRLKEYIPPIIQASELLELIDTHNLIIVDASGGPNAKANYVAKHIKGAVFVDLETQLAEIQNDVSARGRHPLPQIENFARVLSDLGISRGSHVIVYDDKNGGNAAARFWWMMKSAGHKLVQVLSGGIQSAESANIPMSNGTESATEKTVYEVDEWILPLVDMVEVEEASQSSDKIIIDVRDAYRFNGDSEPIDLIAGHIPGAINIPYTENMDQSGAFLSREQLKQKYEGVFGSTNPQNIIVHCGSGVTACHTLLAVAHAGLEIPKLYVGSWSEWSRNNKPMITKSGN